MSLVERCVATYRDEGASAVLGKVARTAYRRARRRAASLRGHYSLTLDGRTVEFSAPTPAVVKRNRRRFESERTALRDFLDELEGGDVVHDVGANTGLYSLFAATECGDGEVVAFEPYPPNLELLRRDVARNGLRNVDVVDVALSDSPGRTEFGRPDEEYAGYGTYSMQVDGTGATVDVPTTTGDRLIADGVVPAPDVLKIDVEGAEPLVLDGFERALSAPGCRLLYCEVHLPGPYERPSVEDFGTTLDAFRARLEAFGFTVERLQERAASEVFLKASR